MPDGATKWAEVDLDAITENARAVSELIGSGVALMAVVKANGYGHGSIEAARAALRGGATWLGVSSVSEGLELRAAGLPSRILNLGYTPPDALAQAVEADLSLTVYEDGTLDALERVPRRHPTGVHVKVDTGMHRLGAQPEAACRLAGRVEQSPAMSLEGLFTHFADADGTDPAFTRAQLTTFLDVRQRLIQERGPGFVSHAANSAGLLRFPDARLDLVRAGIILYGVSPAADFLPLPRLRPALRWGAIVTNLQTLSAGESVGYGRRFSATSTTRIATIAAGYADGLFRCLSNQGHAVLRGRRVPIAGTISMDQAALDVTAVPQVQIGDVAWLIGGEGEARIRAEDVARDAGTIPYEVLCAVSARVPRRYRSDA
ncbi:MAG TPA: alanine racemase [Candidatus Limnocylindrales bacterium]|nr:alanine racemase [Candidatus Limnocylindrales bacterium]